MKSTPPPIRILVMVFLAHILLCGCGQGIPMDKEVLRYSFWGGYLELSIWEELKRTFEEKNPDVYVKLEYAPGSDKPGALVSRMLAGSAADCMMIDDDGLPWLASKRYIEPLNDRIERDAEELRISEIFPVALETAQYEGTYWVLPWDGFCELIYANLDLFEQAGIPEPTKDWTWDDFARIAKQLTRDTNGDGILDQYGTFLMMNILHNQKVLWAFGAEWMDPGRTRITIGSPQAVQALEFYADIFYRKRCVAFAADLSMVEEVMLFTNRVGMVACPAYVMLNLRQLTGKKWDVFHVPRGPAGRAARVSFDCIGIYSKTTPEKKELAWRWIKHVLSSESQRVVGRSGRAMPVRPADVLASFVRDDTPQHEERFLEAMLEYGRTTPGMLASQAIWTVADGIMGRFGTETYNAWGQALLRGEDPPDRSKFRGNPSRWLPPEVTVAELQTKCQAVVDRFKRRGY